MENVKKGILISKNILRDIKQDKAMNRMYIPKLVRESVDEKFDKN